MPVTIFSNKTSGDIPGLDVSIICFCTINAACDSHYLKLLGTPYQSRYFGSVDQMGIYRRFGSRRFESRRSES